MLMRPLHWRSFEGPPVQGHRPIGSSPDNDHLDPTEWGDDVAILRRWTSRIRTKDEEAYVDYLAVTGLDDYRSTPGNLGCQLLLRRLGDGSTQVTMLSWWASIDHIRAFAGDDISRARYYPQDDDFFLEKPLTVEHHEVSVARKRTACGLY